MKNTKNFLIFPLLIMGLFLVFASSCEKDDDDNNGSNGGNGGNGSTFTDPRDGKVYQTVVIGNQEWMAENLAYTPSSGNYWAYDDDNANVETYGYLYDWETALDVCPEGWHLPSDAEWTELTAFLDSVAGGKMKSTTGWNSPNIAATNSSGFSGLPGGYRPNDVTFVGVGNVGHWWNSTAKGTTSDAWSRSLYTSLGIVGRNFGPKFKGLSVRCLRD